MGLLARACVLCVHALGYRLTVDKLDYSYLDLPSLPRSGRWQPPPLDDVATIPRAGNMARILTQSHMDPSSIGGPPPPPPHSATMSQRQQARLRRVRTTGASSMMMMGDIETTPRPIVSTTDGSPAILVPLTGVSVHTQLQLNERSQCA